MGHAFVENGSLSKCRRVVVTSIVIFHELAEFDIDLDLVPFHHHDVDAALDHVTIDVIAAVMIDVEAAVAETVLTVPSTHWWLTIFHRA